MKLVILITLVVLGLSSRGLAHLHIPAGVIDANNNGVSDLGEQLELVEPEAFNKKFHLLPRPVGRRAGGRYVLDDDPRLPYNLDDFTFTVLSLNEDGDLRSPANGAIIAMEIVSVKGPNGGTFHFWDANTNIIDENNPSVAANVEPTYEFAANQPINQISRFYLTENLSNNPNADPYGHIHDRAWSADTAGDYVVGFRLVDVSTNAPGGGPWHQPSQIYYLTFRAGPRFHPVPSLLPNGHVDLTWASLNGILPNHPKFGPGVFYEVQRSSRLDAAEWQTIGSVTGTAHPTVSFTDTAPLTGQAFYRLKYAWKLSSP